MALSWAGGSGPWPGEACWGLLAVPWSGGWLEADGVAEGFELGDKPAVSRSGSRRLVTAMSTNTDSKCVMFTGSCFGRPAPRPARHVEVAGRKKRDGT